MKVKVYSICYNEEYMLPFFLQHYSFADIVVYDNESTDNSLEIMKNIEVEISLTTLINPEKSNI